MQKYGDGVWKVSAIVPRLAAILTRCSAANLVRSEDEDAAAVLAPVDKVSAAGDQTLAMAVRGGRGIATGGDESRPELVGCEAACSRSHGHAVSRALDEHS